jgi:hypothetical protein
MWVWVVWGKCEKELCGETVENNNMGKVWKNCEKKSVGKMWKTITWENCGKFVKRIVWKKCGKEYCEKSVEKKGGKQ